MFSELASVLRDAAFGANASSFALTIDLARMQWPTPVGCASRRDGLSLPVHQLRRRRQRGDRPLERLRCAAPDGLCSVVRSAHVSELASVGGLKLFVLDLGDNNLVIDFNVSNNDQTQSVAAQESVLQISLSLLSGSAELLVDPSGAYLSGNGSSLAAFTLSTRDDTDGDINSFKVLPTSRRVLLWLPD